MSYIQVSQTDHAHKSLHMQMIGRSRGRFSLGFRFSPGFSPEQKKGPYQTGSVKAEERSLFLTFPLSVDGQLDQLGDEARALQVETVSR